MDATKPDTMLKIYHNPRCRKSRAGLNFLLDNKLSFEVIDYMRNPLTQKEVAQLIALTGLKPEALVRTQEDHYKKNLKGKLLTDEQWISEITRNPALLKRPIIVKGDQAIWADPPENATIFI